MRAIIRFGLAVMTIIVLSACTGGHPMLMSTENPALLHGLQGKLLFISTQNDLSTIIRVNADGSDAAPLFANTTEIAIQNRWQNNSLAWSTDGKLLFDSYQDGRWVIFLAQSDGTLHKLTNGMVSDLYPTWSPDGNQI